MIVICSQTWPKRNSMIARPYLGSFFFPRESPVDLLGAASRLFDRMDGSVNVPARAQGHGHQTILILFEKLQANSVLSYRFKAHFSLMIDFRDLSTVFCSREQTFENFVNFCLEHCQIFSHC